MTSSHNRIIPQQLELLKSFKYLTDEKQISEVKELLNLYYRHRLDAAIEEVEVTKGFTQEVYAAWLQGKKD
ncbi:MAG: hypothetical protein ABI378_08740 [Chitinophagaceae bacterium]